MNGVQGRSDILRSVSARATSVLRSRVGEMDAGTSVPGTAHAILQQTLTDLSESFGRVLRGVRWPSHKAIVAFFGVQLWVDALAWTTGTLSVGLVERFFEARSFRNLWGLASFGERTVVSAEAYERIMTVTSFSCGLVTLLVMRHLVGRIVAELRLVRAERRRQVDAS